MAPPPQSRPDTNPSDRIQAKAASERQRRSRPGQGTYNGHNSRIGNGNSFGVSSSGDLDNYHDHDADNSMMRSDGSGRPAGATPEERAQAGGSGGTGGRSSQNNLGRGGRGRGRGRGRSGRAPSRNSIQVGAMTRQSNNTTTSRRLDGTRNRIQVSTLARPGSNITNNPAVETPEERLRRKISSGQSGGSGPYSAAGASSGGSGAGNGTVSDANTSGRSGMMMSVDNAAQNSTPEEQMAERLRRKAAEGARKASNASDYSIGGDGFDDEGYSHNSTPQQRMEKRLRQKAEMGHSNNNRGVSAYLDQQQRMEAKLKGEDVGGGDLEGRVRAKAARADGRAPNTDASTGTLTTSASTHFGRNSTRYGSVAGSRVSYLNAGVSERLQAKAAGGRGGAGAKYDPRANAVGAYAVAGIGRSESGRGRGRGRGRSQGRGRGRSVRGGRSGRMSNGDNPSIFDRRHTSDHNGENFANQSTIATNTQAPDDRDVFDNDHDDLEQARELRPEDRKEAKKIFGLPRTTVLVVSFAFLAAAGIGIGAAARNGAFSSPAPAPTSQTQGANPPSQQVIPPTGSPTASPVARPLGPECRLNKIAGPRIGSSESTVAISGNVAAIGSSDNSPSGSVAIFTRGIDDVWSIESVLSPSNGLGFGRSIDMQDDILVVGSTYIDNDGTKRGCVYVYERDERNGEWKLLVRLDAEDAFKSDESFGSAVAVDFILDDFNERRIQVLVGEPFGQFYPTGEKTGSVHVFTDIAGGGWKLQAKLVPGNGVDGDSFGLALDLADSRAVIANANGSVYSFEQDVERLTVWRQRSKISPVDDPKFGISGSSVSIHHRAVAVGSGGIVRIFDFGRSDEDSILRPSGGDLSSRAFGQNVDIKDDTVIVSAPPFGSATGEDRLFYIFEKNSGNSRWEQASMLESKDAGSHVAVDESTVLVGSQDGGEGFVAELC